MALLNSRLLSFYLTKISTPFRGRFYSCNKQYLSQLPIKHFDLSDPKEKLKYDQLISLSDKMVYLNKTLQLKTKDTEAKQTIIEDLEKTDRFIDQIVYKLYGLTDEEIKIVEGKE